MKLSRYFIVGVLMAALLSALALAPAFGAVPTVSADPVPSIAAGTTFVVSGEGAVQARSERAGLFTTVSTLVVGVTGLQLTTTTLPWAAVIGLGALTLAMLSRFKFPLWATPVGHRRLLYRLITLPQACGALPDRQAPARGGATCLARI